MARYCPLFSGSSGNCCYIGSAAGGVLVDAGVSARRIETALREREIDPGSIRAICVTHEHSDHVAGLRVLTRRYGMPVFASRGTLEELLHAGILGERDAFAVIDEEGIEVADMEITAFPTPHDSAESLGFRIHTADDRRIAVATDMGYMTPVVRKALRGCDLVHIESNHDIRMLENGPRQVICPTRRVPPSCRSSRRRGRRGSCWPISARRTICRIWHTSPRRRRCRKRGCGPGWIFFSR